MRIADAHRNDGKRFARDASKIAFAPIKKGYVLPLLEISRVLVRPDHIARHIVNTNHNVA